MPGDLDFTFNGENIEIVKQFSYLGIVFLTCFSMNYIEISR